MDASNINKWFYNNIRYLRRKHGLTQVQMAEIIGISISTLRKMEREMCFPRVHGMMIWRVCSYFDIPADVLIHEDLENLA